MLSIKDLKKDLEKKIISSSRVLIVPHRYADFDAIGASLGVYLFSKNNFSNKDTYIIDNDTSGEVEPSIRNIIDSLNSMYNIVNIDKIRAPFENDLFVLCDVNKKNLININSIITNPENVFIIDHHEPDSNTVYSNYKYIDLDVSSTSEMVSKLLYISDIALPENIANYLLAGIYLDTNKLTKNVSADTMKIVAGLLDSGASMNEVVDLFKEDFYSDRRVQELISRIEMYNLSLAIIVGDEDVKYTREELAKAADYALRYGCDGVFAVGNIGNDTVSISGRSRERINVASIMQELGGGGNLHSGATKIREEKVSDTAKKLKKILRPNYYIK